VFGVRVLGLEDGRLDKRRRKRTHLVEQTQYVDETGRAIRQQ
jgi:hypothetical protein